ncbi:acyl-CoA thioesterase [Deferrisoma camini]|uniref:acyl-CoA thioesterase n=1 Tax=Deferrisoma camini TaxID=1035120 RepID=UPI00046D13CA|nr:thioesterase family protein [Deferrisoma camini]
MAPPFRHRQKIRFRDTDCQGHVFNANYFAYFDDAVTDFLEVRGVPYPLVTERGHDMVLVRAECDFRSSAVLGEELEIRVRVERFGRTSMTFVLEATEVGSGRTVAEGREVYVVLDRTTGRSCPVPEYLKDALAADRPA